MFLEDAFDIGESPHDRNTINHFFQYNNFDFIVVIEDSKGSSLDSREKVNLPNLFVVLRVR